MKRLTKRDPFDGIIELTKEIGEPIAPYNEVMEALNKLAAYEDAEEQGRLVVLPCKVGDTVWAVGEGRIVGCYIDEACLDNDNNVAYLVSFDCDYDSCISSADFGKTVFLTREAAEAALKEVQE